MTESLLTNIGLKRRFLQAGAKFFFRYNVTTFGWHSLMAIFGSIICSSSTMPMESRKSTFLLVANFWSMKGASIISFFYFRLISSCAITLRQQMIFSTFLIPAWPTICCWTTRNFCWPNIEEPWSTRWWNWAVKPCHPPWQRSRLWCCRDLSMD